jgi:hypothetical protein
MTLIHPLFLKKNYFDNKKTSLAPVARCAYMGTGPL